MRAGELRKRLYFQSRSSAQGTSGGLVTTWSDVVNMRGQLAPATGRQIEAAQALQQELSHVATVRWPGASISITAKMRFLIGARIFDIVSVANVDERNHTLTINCNEFLTKG
jgi:SPP1 family predicted phage head-tail adaptor